MNSSKDFLLTTGEVANKTGVTLRTLRYYDSIGLLTPSHKINGRRFYSYKDLGRLQRILTLKFIGLSLEDIQAIIKNDSSENDVKTSLTIQKEILRQKIDHMNMVKIAIEESLQTIENDQELNWEKIIEIIKAINSEVDWLSQYKTAANLQARIRLHDLFSTNKTGLHRWFFKEYLLKSIPQKARILELGCGDGTLWKRNLSHIPEGWDITLSDMSEGMIKDTKEALDGFNDRFTFKIFNAHEIPFSENTFDVVISNNVLFYAHDFDKTLREISRVLKNSGTFYASTIGRTHLKELYEIVLNFNNSIDIFEENLTEKFGLENGHSKLSHYFSEVLLRRYDDNLYITQVKPLVDYVTSIPCSAKKLLEEKTLKNFFSYIDKLIDSSGGIYVSKDTGIFICKNNKEMVK